MASLVGGLQRIRNEVHGVVTTNDFSIPTWLAIGGFLHMLGQSWLPYKNIAYYFPLLYLVYRVARVKLDSDRLYTSAFADTLPGKWSATLPEQSDATATSDGVVMFLLGARFNHPLGKFTPGGKEIKDAFENMWAEAEKNRTKWSYLGRTPPLFEPLSSEGTVLFWISYWKDLKGLQAFSASAAHRFGQNNYYAKKYPHLGIMHETYRAPTGNWETVYINMPPTGLGTASLVTGEERSMSDIWKVLNRSKQSSSMFSRMGRMKLVEELGE